MMVTIVHFFTICENIYLNSSFSSRHFSETNWLCKKEEFWHPKKPHVEKNKKPPLKAHTKFRTLNVLKLLIDFCYLETKLPSMTDRSNNICGQIRTVS